MANKVLIMGNPTIDEEDAGAALTPGALLDWSSGDVIENATAADGEAQRMFADMNLSDPNDDIDDDYASGDRVHVLFCKGGEIINALLADGESVSKGDPLEAAGSNGALAALSTGAIVAFAHEDKAASTGGGDVRIKVRVA